MTALIVYDSKFGNTASIARAIADGLASHAEVSVLTVSEADPAQLAGYDLVIAGAPTHAFRPSPPMKAFLKSLRRGSLAGVRVAGFDTRIALEDIDIRIVRAMARMFGYAAPHIVARLEKYGGTVLAPPEGFFVRDSEGPLGENELERARMWGASF